LNGAGAHDGLGPTSGSAVPAVERLRGFWFGQTDLAPLGLFRILYGALLFNWFWQLGPNLRAFFTDEGLLPRQLLGTFNPDRLSVLYFFGEWWQVAVLWLLSLAISLLVTVGYHTRLACLLAFVALISFQQRNHLITDGSDYAFRAIAFWLIFAAAGDRFSVDAALRRARGEQVTGFGPAFPIRLLQLQVAWIYLATGLNKLAGSRWLNGTALYYALQLKHTFGRPHAEHLVQFEPFVRLGTWGTLAIELGFLPAAFLPVLQPYVRLLAVAAAAMLHIGILVLMNVGNFPGIMLASLVLFLPPALVIRGLRVARLLFVRPPQTMYYERNCCFCHRTITFIRALDYYETLQFVDAHRTRSAMTTVSLLAPEEHFKLIDDQGRIYSGFAAHARAGWGIPLLLPLALAGAVPGISHLAERVYQLFAARHLQVGSAGPSVSLDRGPKARLAAASTRRPLGAFLRSGALPRAGLALVAAASFATAMPKTVTWPGLPGPLDKGLRYVSLNQSWSMFAPNPKSNDGWLLVPGTLADGAEVDLVDHWGRPRPRHPGMLPGSLLSSPRSSDPLYTRWLKVHRAIAEESGRKYRAAYSSMYCRLRNLHLAPGEPALEKFELIYAKRLIQPPGKGEPRVRQYRLWSHSC
jgi:predicted DCC family thiol-disulfide oxidoreductase YuxK